VNAYVTGGYGAVGGILGLYAVYVRRRSSVLARSMPQPVAAPAPPVPAVAAPPVSSTAPGSGATGPDGGSAPS
jgi:hypothetical protein